MSLTSHLPNLTTREAITDAIYRAMDAFDENDFDMLSSALHSNIVLERGEQVMTGLDELKAQSFDIAGPMDTTHFVTNVRVSFSSETATTATATANVLAQHYPAGKGLGADDRRLLGGTRYYLDLVKDEKDGLWKIIKWILKVVWAEGDVLVVQPRGS